MPYRRLPNTDQARIKSLRMALEKEGDYPSVLSFSTLSEAQKFLPRFEMAQSYYRQCFDNQSKSGKRFQPLVKNARMYISHFIQVLQLAIIRSEIKEEYKAAYKLPMEGSCVPDLSTDSAVLEWGKNIIAGENERLRHGGIPIYNPTIAKVAVHYDLFKEAYEAQKNLQLITSRSLERLASMRGKADEIILDIWNQVEAHFAALPAEARLEKCREYGLIYYYRTGEKKLAPENRQEPCSL